MLFNNDYMSRKSKYFSTWEINLRNQKEMIKFLVTHGISESWFEFFKFANPALELVVDGSKIIESRTHFENKVRLNQIKESISLPIKDWPLHNPFFLELVGSVFPWRRKGVHKMGGDLPAKLKLPDHPYIDNFQYIATLDGSDPNFSWLQIDKLHIVSPIFDWWKEIFLDYDNPNRPKIIFPEKYTSDDLDPRLKKIGQVIVKENWFVSKIDVDIKKYLDHRDEYILCGVPTWLQYPQIPICPKTGEIMKFVCMINSSGSWWIKDQVNATEKLDKFEDKLSWGDLGSLYVFWSPESKVLYINSQS